MKEFKKGGKYLLVYLDKDLIFSEKNDFNTYCPDELTSELFAKKKDMENRIIELGLEPIKPTI